MSDVIYPKGEECSTHAEMTELDYESKNVEPQSLLTNSNFKRQIKYCIKLKHGGYLASSDQEEIMEVAKRSQADTFESRKEAEKIIREKWIDAKIVTIRCR